MDVIAAWQAGVDNVVATLGTAFTAEQAAVMKRFANRLVMAYDGDAAGEKAIVRGIEIASAAGLDLRIVQFPDGLDPDDYIRKYGSAAFRNQITAQTLTVVEFLLNRLRDGADLRNVAGRTEFLRKALEVVATWATPIEQEAVFKRLSQDFQVSVEALKEEFSLIAKRSKRRFQKPDADSSAAAARHGTVAKPLPKLMKQRPAGCCKQGCTMWLRLSICLIKVLTNWQHRNKPRCWPCTTVFTFSTRMLGSQLL